MAMKVAYEEYRKYSNTWVTEADYNDFIQNAKLDPLVSDYMFKLSQWASKLAAIRRGILRPDRNPKRGLHRLQLYRHAGYGEI